MPLPTWNDALDPLPDLLGGASYFVKRRLEKEPERHAWVEITTSDPAVGETLAAAGWTLEEDGRYTMAVDPGVVWVERLAPVVTQ